MNAKWDPSPNFTPAKARAISMVVLHYTAGMTTISAESWLKAQQSRVSAHYLIGRDGAVIQMVRDIDIAWHAGVWAINVQSIGIELAGTDGSGFTQEQLGALWDLLAELVAKYRILPSKVVGHHDVYSGKIDPDGTTHQFPWVLCREVCQSALEGTYTSVRG